MHAAQVDKGRSGIEDIDNLGDRFGGFEVFALDLEMRRASGGAIGAFWIWRGT